MYKLDKKIKKPTQKTRKKLWWVIFIIPIVIYVVESGIIPTESIKSDKKVMLMDKEMEGGAADIRGESETLDKSEGLVDEKYWVFIDNCLERLGKIWYLVFSIIAFFVRNKMVGDVK